MFTIHPIQVPDIFVPHLSSLSPVFSLLSLLRTFFTNFSSFFFSPVIFLFVHFPLLSTYCIMFFNEVYISWNVFLPFLIPRTMFNLYGLLMLHFPFSSHSHRIPFLISLPFFHSPCLSINSLLPPSSIFIVIYLSQSLAYPYISISHYRNNIGKLKNINVSGDQKTFNLPWNVF